MKATKKMQYFRTTLLLAASLVLWNSLQAGAMPRGGGGMGAGGMGAGEPSMPGLSGKVMETMDSGGYTYVLLNKNGVKSWVALPQIKVAVGSEISCQPGMVMSNFNSTSLNRTFETIVFSQGLSGAAAPAPIPIAVSAPVEAISVGKAEGPDANTIGEIFAKKDSLANKPVTVQAKVVKVSRGIMGKNWLHLQDGTGSQAAGTNDLVVTTDSVPEIGAVVIVTGNLSLDRDFGAGYRYGVIIEGAEVAAGK